MNIKGMQQWESAKEEFKSKGGGSMYSLPKLSGNLMLMKGIFSLFFYLRRISEWRVSLCRIVYILVQAFFEMQIVSFPMDQAKESFAVQEHQKSSAIEARYCKSAALFP